MDMPALRVLLFQKHLLTFWKPAAPSSCSQRGMPASMPVSRWSVNCQLCGDSPQSSGCRALLLS